MDLMPVMKRLGSSVAIAASLLLLGACQRPQNQMIRDFQMSSDKLLTAIAIAASAGSQYQGGYGVRGASITDYAANYSPADLVGIRGTHGGSGHAGTSYLTNPFADCSACLNRARSAEFGNMNVANINESRRRVRFTFRCLTRLLVASVSPLIGPIVQFLGPQSFAALRFLVDYHAQSGIFLVSPWLQQPMNGGNFNGLLGNWLFQPGAGG